MARWAGLHDTRFGYLKEAESSNRKRLLNTNIYHIYLSALPTRPILCT